MSGPHNNKTEVLSGTRVLVVEDEFLIALEVAQALSDAGANVVGPATDLSKALDLAKSGRLSCAILDFRLGQDTAAPVARLLTARHIPIIFYTGQVDTRSLEAEWPGCVVLSKPAASAELATAVERAITIGIESQRQS